MTGGYTANVPLRPASCEIVAGSKHVSSDVVPAGQASAARVIRSCSADCPAPLIVPKAAADPGSRSADAADAASAKRTSAPQRRFLIGQDPDGARRERL